MMKKKILLTISAALALSHVTQLWRKLYVRHGESLVAYSIKDN